LRKKKEHDHITLVRWWQKNGCIKYFT